MSVLIVPVKQVLFHASLKNLYCCANMPGMTIELRSTIFGKDIPGTKRRLGAGDVLPYKLEEYGIMGLTIDSQVKVRVEDPDTLKITKVNPLLRHLASEDDPNKGIERARLSKNEITGVRLPKRYPFVRRVFRWIPDEEK